MVRRFALLIPGIALLGCGIALSAQDIGEAQRSLVDARRQSAVAMARSKTLERQASAERDEAARARVEAAAVAARVQSAEADISAAEARIAIVERLQEKQRARLAAKQGPIVRLTAALQTMARRPPALALAQPGSIADLVHVRSLLGAILPVVTERTQGLRAEVAEGRRLRATAELAVASLKDGQAKREQERQSLARLEAQHRLRSREFASGAMLESDRAIALGEKARDIVDLMQQLDADAATRNDLVSLPGPVLRPAQPGVVLAPPLSVPLPASGRLPYRLPVVGSVVTGLGEVSAAGVRARGLTIVTQPGAQVIAPGGGHVLYAAPYRGFGSIVIIDHGNGWVTLVTGLARLGVAVGDEVDQGSPIGRAGPDRPRVTVELRRNGQPIDITPLVS